MNKKVLVLTWIIWMAQISVCAFAAEDSLFINQHVELRNLVIQNPQNALEKIRDMYRPAKQMSESDLGLIQLTLGNVMWAGGDFPVAYRFYTSALQHFEEARNRYGLITTYNDLSLVLIEQKNYEDGIRNLRKASKLNETYGNPWLQSVIYSNMGDVFLRSNVPDSALYYTKESFALATSLRDSSLYAFILKNLSSIYLQQGEEERAGKELKEALIIATHLKDELHKVQIETALGDYYLQIHQPDSAILIYRKALQRAGTFDFEKESWVVSDRMKVFFADQHEYDSAYYYSERSNRLKSSVLGAEKIQLTNSYQKLEEIRQTQLQKEEAKRLESRKHLLQYLIIFILILVFIGGLFLMKKKRPSVFWVEVYLVVFFLIVFEFINLIVHTYATKITHHSPLLILGILVVVAAFLSPLHHRSVAWSKKLFSDGQDT